MNVLHIDLETYSTVNLKTQGMYRYVEDVEIMLMGYALNDEPANVWDWTKDLNKPPKVIIDAARDPNTILAAHHASFERVVLDQIYPTLSIDRTWRCTMIRAHAHGLPGSLQVLSEIYRLPTDKAKDKDGRRLINLFCKPQRNGERATRETHPEDWKKFIEYCRLDVEAERELDKKLPRWNDTDEERALWRLDQTINDRGFAVDIDLAKSAIDAVEKEKKQRDVKTHALTDGAVSAATQRDALLKHILDIHGVELPDMQISTLNRRLEDPNLPEPVKELISLRLQSAGTSTKKYQTLLKSASTDGRLRGALQFCGASRTGRWSGRIFQPQNLPRPTYKNWEIDLGIEAIKAGTVDLIWDDVKAIASSALRGEIVAPERKKLTVADLSSIEGRVLAWLAGEQWKIDAYRDYDAGIGYDMYVWAYANTFRIDPADVTKDQRTLGKPIELALGFGGGPGAFVTFAKVYGINLEELAADMSIFPDRIINAARDFWEWCVEKKKTLDLPEEIFIACDCIKRLWREANPRIVRFWSDLENDVWSTLTIKKQAVRQKYQVDKKGSWIRIRLPSGRYLCYAGAKIDDDKIKYLGVNQYSRKWGYLSTYGGKLAENLTQAASRDILAYGMQNAEAAGYNVVLSVHDELLTETPDTPEFNHNQLSQIMATAPAWAKDLPLAAAGFEAYRYRKD
jgi:DNA polymerase bacteriophage-type